MVKSKRARRFVVGYTGRCQDVAWGQLCYLPPDDNKYKIDDYCHLMTRTEADKARAGMPCPRAVVYELVPVAPNPKGPKR